MIDAEFNKIWLSAAHNAYYFGSHFLGLVSILVLLFLQKKSMKFKRLYQLGLCFACSIMIMVSISEKWQIRMNAAQTEEHKRIVAERDGSNLAFSPFIWLFWGTTYFLIGFAVGKLQEGHLFKLGFKREESIDEY